MSFTINLFTKKFTDILLFLYNVVVYFGNVIISLGAIFNKQWKQMVDGRRDTLKWISAWQRPDNQRILWMHCASLGEFEQGRPLLELIRKQQADTYILLSFFSPSGFRQMNNYDIANHIFYLPSDTRSNAHKLINTIKPDIFINVKYEFWWNLLECMARSDTKLYQISAVFRNSDYFFKAYLHSFKSILDRFENIFVQDILSQDVLKSKGIKTNISIAGDTRVDRVVARSEIMNTPEDLTHILEEKKVIIYGSVWDADMHIVHDCVHSLNEYTHIIVPHDIKPSNVDTIKSKLYLPSVLYSDIGPSASNIYIIDKIGLLSGLYRYGRYAYIGGGFQKGIHNTLEPAAYGLPVFFGPNHQKFIEAVILRDLDLFHAIDNSKSMLDVIKLLDVSEELYREKSNEIKSYIQKSRNASQKIYDTIFP